MTPVEPTDRRSLLVRTPEGVAFKFLLASPVLRLGALAIDTAVVAAAWSVAATGIAVLKVLSVDYAALAAAVGYFILDQGYRMVAEWRWRGQTLGKRLLRLRVIDERGWRLTFSQIAMRNLLRLVDVLPGAYLVGALTALLNRHGQRLGDLAAGTLVIWEPAIPAPTLATLTSGKYNSLRAHPGVVARLRQAVSPREARVAWQAIERRDELEATARVDLFAKLAAHFRGVTPLPPEAVEGVADEQLVRNVVEILYVQRGA